MNEHWGGYDPGDGPLRDDIAELTEKLSQRDAEINRLRDRVRRITEQRDGLLTGLDQKDGDIERLRKLLLEAYFWVVSSGERNLADRISKEFGNEQ